MYISRSLLQLPDDTDQLAAIQLIALARNRDADITGLMIATTRNFTQYLEGETDALAAVVESIVNDARHTDLIFVDTPQLAERRFPIWRMAWFGPDKDTDLKMHPFLTSMNGSLPPAKSVHLLKLMEELSSAHGDIP